MYWFPSSTSPSAARCSYSSRDAYAFRLAQITYEKEHGLEMMMRMMGLGNWTNLFVLYVFYYLMYTFYIIVFMLAGSAIGWTLFTKNSYGEWFALWWVNHLWSSLGMSNRNFPCNASQRQTILLVCCRSIFGSTIFSLHALLCLWNANFLEIYL